MGGLTKFEECPVCGGEVSWEDQRKGPFGPRRYRSLTPAEGGGGDVHFWDDGRKGPFEPRRYRNDQPQLKEIVDLMEKHHQQQQQQPQFIQQQQQQQGQADQPQVSDEWPKSRRPSADELIYDQTKSFDKKSILNTRIARAYGKTYPYLWRVGNHTHLWPPFTAPGGTYKRSIHQNSRYGSGLVNCIHDDECKTVDDVVNPYTGKCVKKTGKPFADNCDRPWNPSGELKPAPALVEMERVPFIVDCINGYLASHQVQKLSNIRFQINKKKYSVLLPQKDVELGLEVVDKMSSLASLHSSSSVEMGTFGKRLVDDFNNAAANSQFTQKWIGGELVGAVASGTGPKNDWDFHILIYNPSDGYFKYVKVEEKGCKKPTKIDKYKPWGGCVQMYNKPLGTLSNGTLRDRYVKLYFKGILDPKGALYRAADLDWLNPTMTSKGQIGFIDEADHKTEFNKSGKFTTPFMKTLKQNWNDKQNEAILCLEARENTWNPNYKLLTKGAPTINKLFRNEIHHINQIIAYEFNEGKSNVVNGPSNNWKRDLIEDMTKGIQAKIGEKEWWLQDVGLTYDEKIWRTDKKIEFKKDECREDVEILWSPGVLLGKPQQYQIEDIFLDAVEIGDRGQPSLHVFYKMNEDNLKTNPVDKSYNDQNIPKWIKEEQNKLWRKKLQNSNGDPLDGYFIQSYFRLRNNAGLSNFSTDFG